MYVATVNQTRLDMYLAAEAKILSGQSVRLGDRQVDMADLADVRKQITILQAAVDRESLNGSGRGGRFSQADFGGRA